MCPSHLVLSQFKCTCFVFIKLHQILSFKTTIALFLLIKLSPSILLKRKKRAVSPVAETQPCAEKGEQCACAHDHTHQCSLSWSPAILMALQRFHQQNSFKKNSKDWSKCEHRTNNQHAEIVCGWHFLCMSANIYTHTRLERKEKTGLFILMGVRNTHLSLRTTTKEWGARSCRFSEGNRTYGCWTVAGILTRELQTRSLKPV